METRPPSYVVRTPDGREIGTERHLLKASPEDCKEEDAGPEKTEIEKRREAMLKREKAAALQKALMSDNPEVRKEAMRVKKEQDEEEMAANIRKQEAETRKVEELEKAHKEKIRAQ